MRQAHTGAAIAAAAGLATTAGARIVIEDFVDSTNTLAQFDPFFTYDFGTSTDYSGMDGHGLFPGVMTLFPDQVTITFGTWADETVIDASVTARDIAGVSRTRVEYVGEFGSHIVTNTATGVEQVLAYDAAWGIGTIQAIRISGDQTLVSNITVETTQVPAPATVALGAVGAGVIARRRRR